MKTGEPPGSGSRAQGPHCLGDVSSTRLLGAADPVSMTRFAATVSVQRDAGMSMGWRQWSAWDTRGRRDSCHLWPVSTRCPRSYDTQKHAHRASLWQDSSTGDPWFRSCVPGPDCPRSSPLSPRWGMEMVLEVGERPLWLYLADVPPETTGTRVQSELGLWTRQRETPHAKGHVT